MSKFLRKTTYITIVILFIAILNIFNVVFHGLPENTSSRVDGTLKRVWSHIENDILRSEPTMKGNVEYYQLAKDTHYHYEFRFEFNTNSTNDDSRLMILLNGKNHTCVDYWDFPVGRRILSTLRTFRFSILSICSKKEMFDGNGPVEKNSDVKWIYLSLQKWINEVYYKQFQQYPRLYIHGVSRGSKLAALLSRVLPIQAQILTINPGHDQGLLTHSDHHIDMQTRLQLDPVFANWFYFDFCYYKKIKKDKIINLCPFENRRNNYQPVPPTYFIHLSNDPFYKVSDYALLVERIRKDAFQLGGTLLNHSQSINLYVLHPSNATPLYMQQYFHIWNSKSSASSLFYQHFIERESYKSSNEIRRTCSCLPTDFTYFEQYPNITKTWSKQKQDEYKDYVRDVKQFKRFFCEDVCGDLYAHHAMSSRDLNKILHLINVIDDLRHSLYITDYLTRSLRIWMYEKDLIITKDNYFSDKPNYVNITKQYYMYAPEYYLQDYFQLLKSSSTYSRHNFQWTDNPLLADYFIIPSDLTFHYFYRDITTMNPAQFENLIQKLNKDYFTPLLTNIQTMFPYWTMAKQADQMGSNHILTILTGRNMGIFYNNTQNILKNVIQVVFTGVRQDLLSMNATPARDFRRTIIVYRHGYDVVIPQYTELKFNESTFQNLNMTIMKKKRLFFFAGDLSHTMTQQSARPLLSSVWKDISEKNKSNIKTDIQGTQFGIMKIINGHMKPNEYIESIQSSVFLLCPEGYFPWSPRIYEAIQLGAIPTILADNFVLPFERFIDWRLFSAKINISHVRNITEFVSPIENFQQYIKQKLTNAIPYFHAFQWPYSAVGENGHKEHVYLPYEDKNGSAINAFHYVSLELRCRRLEQLYGLTSNTFSLKSIEAQRQACINHPNICPCHNKRQPLAFTEYL